MQAVLARVLVRGTQLQVAQTSVGGREEQGAVGCKGCGLRSWPEEQEHLQVRCWGPVNKYMCRHRLHPQRCSSLASFQHINWQAMNTSADASGACICTCSLGHSSAPADPSACSASLLGCERCCPKSKSTKAQACPGPSSKLPLLTEAGAHRPRARDN